MSKTYSMKNENYNEKSTYKKMRRRNQKGSVILLVNSGRALMGSEANGKRELSLPALLAFEGGTATRAEAADGVRFGGTYNGHHTLRQRPVYVAACYFPLPAGREPAVAPS
ncbi:hypothetical protein HAX54_003808 [Datura stramonium]|uniref:Uncharacterized protein n=1 Tax=Datura stramonium TaxID=4076 RepID=A0ABS8WW62_DATST|nr:hypothetical protein [Datura stramonium]